MLTTIALTLVLAAGPDDDAAAALALAQATVKREALPSTPPKQEKSSYQRGRERAVELDLPLAVWVGTKQWHREIPGAVTVWTPKLDGFDADTIVIGCPDKKQSIALPSNATDDDIQRALARLEGRPIAATPFGERIGYPSDSRRPAARPDGDDSAAGPWLPKSEQDKIKAMWPEGVPLPDGLKFYRLPRASQRVASLGGSAFHTSKGHLTAGGDLNYIFYRADQDNGENVNNEFPYSHSGGLNYTENGTARNVTGMVIPQGKKIRVWLQRKPVMNPFGTFQWEPALTWDYPAGTQVFDVLIREGSSPHIFSVRRRTKTENGWDGGVSFFPDAKGEVAASGVTLSTKHVQRLRDVLGVTDLSYRYVQTSKLTGKQKFAELKNTLGMTDGGHFFPPGFMGAGMACSKCHNVASLSSLFTAAEKADYGGVGLAGSDTVYSWYPIRVEDIGQNVPRLDYRWPLTFDGQTIWD